MPPPPHPQAQAPVATRLISIHPQQFQCPPQSLLTYQMISLTQMSATPTSPLVSQSPPYCAAVTRSKGKMSVVNLEPPQYSSSSTSTQPNPIDELYTQSYESLSPLPPLFNLGMSSTSTPTAAVICEKLIRAHSPTYLPCLFMSFCILALC